MVNKVVLNYLKSHSGKYPIKALKQKAISSGYSKKEVEEAAASLNLNKPIKQNPRVQRAVQNVSFESPSKLVKIAGVSGILMVLTFLIYFILSNFSEGNSLFQKILLILVSIFSIIFSIGFVSLGKKHDQSLLRIGGGIFVILSVILLLFNILMVVTPDALGNLLVGDDLNLETLSEDVIAESITEIMAGLIVLVIIVGVFLIIAIIAGIVLGIGLLKLKKQLKFAKAAGILNIIAWATTPIIMGFLILLVAWIFNILVLFKSNKPKEQTV